MNMKKHHMKILDKYIEPIKLRKKRREYRLNDNRRKSVKVGDVLVLVGSKNTYIEVSVTNIQIFNDWEQALKHYWTEDFAYLKISFDKVLEECKSYYENIDVSKFGIIVFDIVPINHELKNARVLLDTNVIIERESYLNTNYELSKLFKWFDKLHMTKFIHEESINEVSRYQDEKVKKPILSKLDIYEKLMSKDNYDDFFNFKLKKYDSNVNSLVDNRLLNQLYTGRVDFLVTQDKLILRKADDLYLQNQVFSINDFLEHIETSYPKLVDYEVLSIRKVKFDSIDLNDPFFDTLKEDYAGFTQWFNNKTNEEAYVFTAKERMAGFLYLKIEECDSSYSKFDPPFEPKKRLKIGIYKADYRGIRLGERYLKIIFDNAVKLKVEEIYVTMFENKRKEITYLIKLLERWGFEKHGYNKSNGELIMVKKLMSYNENKTPYYNYPVIKKNPRYFILPIYPEYHSDLFPDFKLSKESMHLYKENKAHHYALEKNYISGAAHAKAEPGDIFLIYRQGRRHPKKYSSVISGIAVLGEVKEPKNFQEYINLCSNKTIFSVDKLKNFYDSKNWKKVIKLINDVSFENKVILDNLYKFGVVESGKGPRPFHEITREQFIKIAEKGGIEWERY